MIMIRTVNAGSEKRRNVIPREVYIGLILNSIVQGLPILYAVRFQNVALMFLKEICEK